jgi:hypothetical protein
VRLVPVPNGLFPVKAENEPPFGLPVRFAAGMLSPEPSVKAAVALEANAYSVKLLRVASNAQAVVIEICDEPAAVPLEASVKFTLEGLAEIVSDSGSVAVRFTVAELELTCASTTVAQPIVTSVRTTAAREPLCSHRGAFRRTEFIVRPFIPIPWFSRNHNSVARIVSVP